MSLPNVSAGSPHVAAHNAERAQINALLAQVENLPDDNDPRLVQGYTSTTRPAAVNGRIIYESDTKRHTAVINGEWTPITNVPMVQAWMEGTHTHTADATPQGILLEGCFINNDNMWSASAPDRFTIRTDGLYRIHGKIAYEPNGNGVRGIFLQKNGISLSEAFLTSNGLPGVYTTVAIPTSIELFEAGDVLTFFGWQNSGGNLGYAEGATFTKFGLEYVGPIPS